MTKNKHLDSQKNMISSLYKLFSDRFEDKRKKAFEQERKLEKLIELLTKDEETEVKNNTEAKPHETEEIKVEFSSSKNEGKQKLDSQKFQQQTFFTLTGVVTELNKTGGFINHKHSFTKIIAGSAWAHLKVGSKLSFTLFEGSVPTIVLLESEWDDGPVEVPDTDNTVGYSTDVRTIIGSLVKVSEGIFTIETGSAQELFVPVADHPDLKWFFLEGDVVSFVW